jgi:hypothetical protein
MTFVLYNGKFLLREGKLATGGLSCCCCTTHTIYEGVIGKWGPDVRPCMCITDWERYWGGAITQILEYENCYGGAVASVLEFYTKAGYEIVTPGGASADTTEEFCKKTMKKFGLACDPGSLDCGCVDEDCVGCAPYAEGEITVKCCKTKKCKEINLIQDPDDGLYHYLDNGGDVEICKPGGPLPSIEIEGKYYPDIKISACCMPD